MTTATAFWRDPDFVKFLPYVKATAAWDKRHGNHPRFDLKSNTPWATQRDALAYVGPCCACGARINPFRTRANDGGVYLAVACENSRRFSCSRGNRASAAYDAIWSLIKDISRADGEQGGLL